MSPARRRSRPTTPGPGPPAAARGTRAGARPSRSAGRGRSPRAPATAATALPQSGTRAFTAPLALTLALLLVSLVPRVQANAVLAQSLQGAALVLLAWQIVLAAWLRHRGAVRSLEVSLRPQHYVQAAVQLSVFAYWGWFWRPVYEHAWLLVAQLLFAYAFDLLLAWSRRERYALGFGPFPIIFSTNLFLWFRDDWFHLQFLMIAVGFLGKEFVRWEREGRRVHIFNPSAFSLGLFSVALLATGATPLTWGEEIATTLTLAPRIYLFLFLAGLVVMYRFAITLVAGSAAIVLFGLSALYAAATGIPYFIDSEIPTAVFLGLHLLVTDPSTSPRSPVGKAVFGVLYGAGVFVLYALLGALGAPTFYDKLLSVPLLNLCVPWIDRLAGALQAHARLARVREGLAHPRANLVQMAVWILFFAAMTGLGATDGRHRGDAVPFWEQACAGGNPRACERLLGIEASYCADASAWACNELGRHYASGVVAEADPELALDYFARACELRFRPACLNLLEPGRTLAAPPKVLDLRLLLREGGRNLMDTSERDLHERACDHGWRFAC
ncbi:MAG: hypothetical protein OXH75_11905 [Acidobacteria bacterium]|nr:hypothetical protein [Acidobacteriota bacterium]